MATRIQSRGNDEGWVDVKGGPNLGGGHDASNLMKLISWKVCLVRRLAMSLDVRLAQSQSGTLVGIYYVRTIYKGRIKAISRRIVCVRFLAELLPSRVVFILETLSKARLGCICESCLLLSVYLATGPIKAKSRLIVGKVQLALPGETSWVQLSAECCKTSNQNNPKGDRKTLSRHTATTK